MGNTLNDDDALKEGQVRVRLKITNIGWGKSTPIRDDDIEIDERLEKYFGLHDTDTATYPPNE